MKEWYKQYSLVFRVQSKVLGNISSEKILANLISWLFFSFVFIYFNFSYVAEFYIFFFFFFGDLDICAKMIQKPVWKKTKQNK